MVVHLGRLKLVTSRKEASCRYKHCKKDNKIAAGARKVLLTKLGNIKGKALVFGKYYHPECFGPWLLYMVETLPDYSRDGRPPVVLDAETKLERSKWVRERARLHRILRDNTDPRKLDRLVTKIGELNRQIEATGVPVGRYGGRRSKSEMEFVRWMQELKDKYGDPRRVTSKSAKEATEKGWEAEYWTAMEEWYQETIKREADSGKQLEQERLESGTGGRYE